MNPSLSSSLVEIAARKDQPMKKNLKNKYQNQACTLGAVYVKRTIETNDQKATTIFGGTSVSASQSLPSPAIVSFRSKYKAKG